MLMVTAGSVNISACFDVLSLSSRIGFFGESVMEGSKKRVTANSQGVSRDRIKGCLQSCKGYSCARRYVKFKIY